MSIVVADLVLAAQEYVRRAVGLELDQSVESLAYVDHYLSQVGKVGGEVLGVIAAAIGAYFGEVVIGHLGGRWISDGDPAEWRVVVSPVPLSFHPVGMTAEAIRRGEVEGYDGSLSVPAEVEETLAMALAAGGPVEESYYYSLTGRLETLEHAVELLVEMRRLRLVGKEDEQEENQGS